MTYSQPQFIQFNNNTLLPSEVRNKYFIYIIIGTPNIMGVPGLYVQLDKLDKLSDFIDAICLDDSIIYNGTENFIINTDYYINDAVKINDNGSEEYNDANEYFKEDINKLPVYWHNGINNEYFNNIDDNDKLLKYYINKNNYLNYIFSEEELNDFYSTFCKLIINLTTFTDYNTTVNNQIYNKVLNYFANNKSDDSLNGINIILNTLYSVSSSSSSCGCSSSSTSDNSTLCSTSCSDYYKSAMEEYLKTMLGNYEFYLDWFFIDEDEYNEELVNQLEIFIDEFLSLDLNISLSNSSSSNCDCPTVSSSDDSCNRGIINNFKNILTYVKENTIEENRNKIKIYGEQFGELLPNLQF